MKFASPTIEIEYIRLSDLAAKFLQGNAKRHDLDTIAASIRRYGFRDPIALDSSLNAGAGGVPEGNGRLEALIMMRDRGDGVPRFVAAIGDDWAVPVLVGANSESESEGLAYSIDHNLTGLKPSDFDTLDLATLFDETYLDLLKSLDMLPLMATEDDLLLLDGDEVEVLSWEDAAEKLPDGDREPFQQMTFTLHDSQIDIVKAALDLAKSGDAFESENANSNGNALARVCEFYGDAFGKR